MRHSSRRVKKWWTEGIRDNGGGGRNKECGHVLRIGGHDGIAQKRAGGEPRPRLLDGGTRNSTLDPSLSPLLPHLSSPNHSLDHLISSLLQICVGYFNPLTCTGTLPAIDLTTLPPLGRPNRPPVGTT